MSILHKVKARKIAFLYYYQHHFVQKINRYDISDTIVEDPIIDTDVIQSILNQQDIDPVSYIGQSQLGYMTDQYDSEFACTLIDAYDTFSNVVSDAIKPYTTTFAYEEMNAIEQSIIHLGYTEYQVLHTPYKVIIDQMVEFAKRYSSPNSAKLINWLLHTLFTTWI